MIIVMIILIIAIIILITIISTWRESSLFFSPCLRSWETQRDVTILPLWLGWQKVSFCSWYFFVIVIVVIVEIEGRCHLTPVAKCLWLLLLQMTMLLLFLLLVLLILTKGLLLQTDIVRVSVIKSLGCHCQILTSTTCQEFVIVVVVCEVTWYSEGRRGALVNLRD